MTKSLFLLPLALAVAAPAGATGGLICRTAGERPIETSMVIGHGVGGGILSSRLTDNGRGVAVRVAQSWIDNDKVLLDLVDPVSVRHELRLNVRRSGATYDGSLWRGSKRHWVRCRED